MSNARKFRYYILNPELEKLNLMFGSVVAIGIHSWTPNEEIVEPLDEHGDPKHSVS